MKFADDTVSKWKALKTYTTYFVPLADSVAAVQSFCTSWDRPMKMVVRLTNDQEICQVPKMSQGFQAAQTDTLVERSNIPPGNRLDCGESHLA